MNDPKRLSELGSEAPDALRGLLRASRDDVPAAARIEGLAARLGPLLGGAAVGLGAEAASPGSAPSPQAPPADPSAAASAATGSGAVAKAVGVGAAIVVLVGGAWLMTRPDPASKQPSSVSEPAQTSPASRTEPKVAPGVAAPSSPQSPSAAESAGAPAKAPPSEATRSHPGGPSESALLAQAQAALKNNPTRALSLTREHKRRFPNGALAQEREVIAIEALNRIGEGEAARKRAKDFENSYPGSAHRRKVENATKP